MAKKETQRVVITPPNFQIATIPIVGISPLVMNKFSSKTRREMADDHIKGSASKNKKKHEPKDFDEIFEDAIHYSEEGWIGFPAAAFRQAMISACRVAGFQMTKAKLTVFIEADGIDADEGIPLVKLKADRPEQHECVVRVGGYKPDIRIRPMWRKWAMDLRIKWDADQFTLEDVYNLLYRAGIQVGIGEGRPDTKSSDGAGMGWGQFTIAEG